MEGGIAISGLDRRAFLEEGFIAQTPEKKYILAQGPFARSSAARPFSLYRPDFFLKDKKVWIQPQQSLKLDSKQLYEFLFPKKERETNQKEESSIEDFFSQSQKPSFLSYQQSFIQAQELIRQKKLEKIVPVFSEVFFKRAPLLKFLQRLFQNTFFLEGYLYGIWDKSSGLLGFTPELLFRLKDNSFSTMALAGTALKNAPSLLKDPKQVKEHEFVVKGLKESLKNHIQWRSAKRSEMAFPPLKHLRTDLTGSLASASSNLTSFFKKRGCPLQSQPSPLLFESFCRLLHPSSAVGGYPKKEAQDWLEKHNSQKRRKFYAAPFGFYESCKESFCLVALRNIQWNEKESFIFSGAGWIAESSLQEEWRELSLKRRQARSFFTYCQKDFERVFSKS